MRIVANKHWRVYLDFWRVGSLYVQLYCTYHSVLHMCVAVNSHALPVYKKNRIASLLCIFETTIILFCKYTVLYILHTKFGIVVKCHSASFCIFCYLENQRKVFQTAFVFVYIPESALITSHVQHWCSRLSCKHFAEHRTQQTMEVIINNESTITEPPP